MSVAEIRWFPGDGEWHCLFCGGWNNSKTGSLLICRQCRCVMPPETGATRPPCPHCSGYSPLEYPYCGCCGTPNSEGHIPPWFCIACGKKHTDWAYPRICHKGCEAIQPDGKEIGYCYRCQSECYVGAFCGRCGASTQPTLVEPSAPAEIPPSAPSAATPVQPALRWYPEMLGAVARYLSLLAHQTNLRDYPLPGDLKGEYDQWFDGGAVKRHTGTTFFGFSDGAFANVHNQEPIEATVYLPDGTAFRIGQFRDDD